MQTDIVVWMAEGKTGPTTRRRIKRRLLIPAVIVLVTAPVWGYYLYTFVIASNFQNVVPGKVYRSGQPRPGQLRSWAGRYGIKTVINLRGDAGEVTDEEKAVTAELGIRMISLAMSARSLPSSTTLVDLIESIETAQQPMLLHCYHGVDRAGFAGFLAAMAIGNESYTSAKSQIHVKQFGTDGRVPLSGMLDLYEGYCRRAGVERDGWPSFRHWATEVYHPYYFHVDIAAPKELNLKPGQREDVAVQIINKADEAIPAGDPNEVFSLMAYTGQPVFQKDRCRQLGEPTRLPGKDIPPGGKVSVTHILVAPEQPGQYAIYLDLMQEKHTSFGHQGSPTASIKLSVQP